MFKDMFKKTYTRIDTGHRASSAAVPEGMWRKCRKCGAPIYVDDVIANHYICPKWGGYFPAGSARACRR